MEKNEKLVISDPNFLVKPPKKERTEAQKQATAKAYEALKAKREKMNAIVAETNPELVEKKPKKSASKPTQVKQEKQIEEVEQKQENQPQDDVYNKLLTTLMSRMESSKPVAKEIKKEKKKKVVIVEEDDSSSEEEIVIKKKKESGKPRQDKPVEPTQTAQPSFQSTGSYVFDKLLFSKF